MNRLILGLGLVKTMALVCSGIGGLWLTQQVLAPIEQTFQRLKQFTADASHELRNPLTAINTAVEVMQSHPERIHPLDTNKLVAIASATDQLTSLAEDLLFLARTDAAITPVELDGISVPLDEVLQDLVELFNSQTQAKEITLTSQLLVGISVKGEVAELKRLFFNLLDNACKYTPTGGSVSLSMAKHKRFVVVEVKDTGIGIAPEYQSFIFQRFWRSI